MLIGECPLSLESRRSNESNTSQLSARSGHLVPDKNPSEERYM